MNPMHGLVEIGRVESLRPFTEAAPRFPPRPPRTQRSGALTVFSRILVRIGFRLVEAGLLLDTRRRGSGQAGGCGVIGPEGAR
jgi:hypothetical protein